jgi:hypothetical protein
VFARRQKNTMKSSGTELASSTAALEDERP